MNKFNFEKIRIDIENKCEACSVFDINGDGIPEIVCGEYWYEGPDFQKKHKFCDITYEHGYVHDFSDYPLDTTGSGKLDIITGSWWGDGLYVRENSGSGEKWRTKKVAELTNIETIRYFDIDGCGTVEIFPNTPNEPQCFFKLKNGEFVKYVISAENSGHGMGFGDINGDGKTDIILSNGWLEQPDNIFTGPWTFHGGFEIPMACVPMLCCDINGDGLNDIIAGAGHNYGLWWLEQKFSNGKREWIKHDIDLTVSQYHDMQLFDIDGDGKEELITGSRYFAHNGNDPGENDPIGTYIFEINGGNFIKHTLDYGQAGQASGLGIYFWLYDFDGGGKTDIVAPGKEGLYIFKNKCGR